MSVGRWPEAESEADSGKKRRKLNADSVNPVSWLLFLWVGRLVAKSSQGPVDNEDLIDVPEANRVLLLLQRFDAAWCPETRTEKEKTKHCYLSKVTRQLFMKAWICSGVLMGLQQLGMVAIPLLTEQYLLWYADDSAEQWGGWMLIAICIAVMFFSNMVASNHAILQLYVLGMDVRSLFNALVYRKAMRLSHKARGQTTTGQVVTLMSTDCERLPMSILGLHSLWISPIFIAATSALLIWKVGVSAFVGLVILAISFPMPMKIGIATMKATIIAMKSAEKRVKAVNEGLQGIRVLKYYAWDEAYGNLVRGLRNDEVGRLLWIYKLGAISNSQMAVMPLLMGIGMLVAFFLIDPARFTPATVFLSLQLLNIIRMPLTMLPMAIKGLAELKATFLRLERFFLLEEVGENDNMLKIDGFEGRLQIAGASFAWGSAGSAGLEDILAKGKGKGKGDTKGKGKGDDKGAVKSAGLPTEDKEKHVPGFILSNINLAAEPGHLCAVVGAVGSGKSSLLQAMLGEMPQQAGKVTVHGSTAYCAQSPWIQNASVRDNILFNLPLDCERYEEVLDMCALRPDLDALPGGDETEIGEKGVTLSGGQKARVALARAAYSQASVFVLDDVLSAVDAETGQTLFEECIQRLVAMGKLVILATNQQHFLPQADVIWVVRDGTVAEQGSYSELRSIEGGALNSTLSIRQLACEDGGAASPTKASLQVATPSTTAGGQSPLAVGAPGLVTKSASLRSLNARSSLQRRGSDVSLTAGGLVAKKKSTASLTSKETKAEGSVSWKVWHYYFVSCSGGWFTFFALVFILSAAQAVKNLMEWWLSHWADALAETGDASLYFVYVYMGLGLLACAGTLIRSFFLASVILHNAKVLHERLLHSVLRAPMSFFDTTPLGRVLNRFSKDMDSMDTGLQRCLPICLQFFFDILGLLITIACGMPLFIVPVVPLMVCYWDVQRRFRPLSRDLQRLESISRSPIFAQFSETLGGITTIRAYSCSQLFLDTCLARVDESNRAFFTIHNCNRWLQLRLEGIAALLFLSVGCFGIQGKANGTLTAGFMGLALFYTTTCAGLLNFGLRMFADTEARMTSAERIHEYITDLESEAALVTDMKLPKDGKGEISFQSVAVRYRAGSPLVLKGISMVIPGGTKVGICGRTGCGKSTLLNVLFRLTDIAENGEGRILLDGVSIVDLGLRDLRHALAIIPQDAVMFAGTLRENLDLFGEYTEEQLQSAIRHASLEEVLEKLPNGLASSVQEGGENFSCGQRQLVCLARALLRRSRVICLDEATANIDARTDETIQAVIRQEFKSSTVLTIAHRLNTIAHADRICFLEAGQVAEYDTPAKLLARGPEGKFWGLVHEMGEEASAQLQQDVRMAAGGDAAGSPPAAAAELAEDSRHIGGGREISDRPSAPGPSSSSPAPFAKGCMPSVWKPCMY